MGRRARRGARGGDPNPNPNPNPHPHPNPNPNPDPIPNQVLAGACEKGVEDACDALTREEEAKAVWLAKQESSSWLAGVSPTHLVRVRLRLRLRLRVGRRVGLGQG
eukprot:scaffold58468_cov41-Phaeocystis_antarctica.AAC.1